MKELYAFATASLITLSSATESRGRIETSLTVFDNKSEWNMSQSFKNDVCVANASYNGDVELGLFWYPRTDIMAITVHDPVLESIKEGVDYKIKVAFSKNSGFDDGWGEKAATGDIDSNKVPGFRIFLKGSVILADLAEGNSIAFFYKDKLIDSLKLKGSTLMISEMRRCSVEIVKNHPIDPFED